MVDFSLFQLLFINVINKKNKEEIQSKTKERAREYIKDYSCLFKKIIRK